MNFKVGKDKNIDFNQSSVSFFKGTKISFLVNGISQKRVPKQVGLNFEDSLMTFQENQVVQ